jgi:hypothetical protein
MAKKRGTMDRRDFFKAGTGTVVAGALGLGGHPAEADDEKPTSRVVLIRREDAVGEDGSLRDHILPGMLDDAVTALFETDDAPQAWRRVVGPDDVVGIKSNEWGRLPTPAALEQAIVERVAKVGVDQANISVDDRGVLHNPVFQRATTLINIRPLRTHHWSGLGTCLKNLISFVPRPSEYHGDTCAPLGAIWHLPELEGKVRLNVLVMLTPQFHGIGPHSFSKQFVWPYAGLIVSADPVAADATGARIIEAKRREFFGDERPISPSPHHIQVADTRYGLGASDPERIELVRLGWQKDALI